MEKKKIDKKDIKWISYSCAYALIYSVISGILFLFNPTIKFLFPFLIGITLLIITIIGLVGMVILRRLDQIEKKLKNG